MVLSLRREAEVAPAPEPVQEAHASPRSRRAPQTPVRPCVHRGPTKGVKESTCCGNVDQIDCAARKQEVYISRCRSCKHYEARPPREPQRIPGEPTVSVIITSCQEGEELVRTCQSIEVASPNLHELIVIDDASDPPERTSTRRNDEREGVARSRHLGGLDATGDVVLLMDGHMRVKPGDIETVAKLAVETRGFAYAGCNGHYAARLTIEGGLFRCKWMQKPEQEILPTTAMMGAFYAVPRDILESMGGWIGLPGQWGMDEEAMSVLAARHNIPIHAHTGIQTWHWFRDPPQRPYDFPVDRYLVNVAAMYRLLFDDPAWGMFKARLRRFTWDTGYTSIGDDLMLEIEDPAVAAYGEQLRSRFAVNDLDFLMSPWPGDPAHA